MKQTKRTERSETIGRRVLETSIDGASRDWIVTALDPFHDFQRQLGGYPDADSSHTIVSCVTKEVTITKPANSTTWDCHVFTMPIAHPTTLRQAKSVSGEYYFTHEATTFPLSTLNIWKSSSGQPLFSDASNLFAPADFESDVLDGSDFIAGSSRVIAMGFEVVNTTADVYKQGAITAYRLPQSLTNSFQLCEDRLVPPHVGSRPLVLCKAPPSSSAAAMLLGGSKQWAAADGCYSVATQCSVHNPLTSGSPVGTAFCPLNPISTGSYRMEQQIIKANTDSASPIVNAWMSEYQQVVPFNTSGVYLTGLSEQTSLRIKLRMYIERAPTSLEGTVVTLATPSTPYDARALEIYSSVLSTLPVSVPVAMNGFGDWFRMVLQAVGNLAIPVGSLFGAPGAAIGSAVRTVANAVEQAGFKQETVKALSDMDRKQKDMADQSAMVNRKKKTATAVKKTNGLVRIKVAKKNA